MKFSIPVDYVKFVVVHFFEIFDLSDICLMNWALLTFGSPIRQLPATVFGASPIMIESMLNQKILNTVDWNGLL